MKIITYNIHNHSQEKIDSLLEYGADVYILPEIHSSTEVALPEECTCSDSPTLKRVQRGLE